METTNKKEVNAMIFNELIQQAKREEAENNKMAYLPLVYLALTYGRV